MKEIIAREESQTEELESQFISLFDFLGRAAGPELGAEVSEAAIASTVQIKSRKVKTATYKGEVSLYPKWWLENFFAAKAVAEQGEELSSEEKYEALSEEGKTAVDKALAETPTFAGELEELIERHFQLPNGLPISGPMARAMSNYVINSINALFVIDAQRSEIAASEYGDEVADDSPIQDDNKG